MPNEQKTLSQPVMKYYDEAPRVPITNAKPTFAPPKPQPLVDLQVYQQQPPKSNAPPKTINPAMYVPMNLPVAGPYTPPQYSGFPPQYNPYWPMYSPQLVNPVIKQYSINNAPFLETTTLKTGSIREDVLPKQMSNTSNTLGERLNIHSFVRSVFIKTYDGEDIDIDGQGTNSILRYLKFLELNPYSPESNVNNPYMGMPTDMLLYRSCYPIKYDDKTNSLQCSPNSLGMNVRIYTLSFAEYNIKKLSSHDFYDFDIWREMAYYEYIRENILKKKVCPNFVLMHCYYISENCHIDKNKVLLLKGKSTKQFGQTIAYLIKQLQIFIQDVKSMQKHIMAKIPPFITLKHIQNYEQELVSLQSRYKELNSLQLAHAEKQQLNQTQVTFANIATELQKLVNLFKKNPSMVQQTTAQQSVITINPPTPYPSISQTLYDFSGKGLVSMTESPTYNFYDWASIKYEAKGNIHTMINTGFHTSDVWMSVLFQMMIGLHVLQKHKIAFREFSIGDNIYIKDIADHNNGKSYWKYVIDSYEYYIPNYGYLVLFDTNYKDIEDTQSTLLTQTNTEKYYKIYSNIFKAGVHDDTRLHNQCFDAFVNTFNVNNFTKSFANYGGSGIPDDIKKLFGDITTEMTKGGASKNISHYINTHMTPLLNNRVGTNLTELEHKFINNTDTNDFTRGQIIVHEIAAETYKFVIYSGNATGVNGNVNILTKTSNNELGEMVVHRSSLKHYSKHESITQNLKNGTTFNETDLLEIYTC